jgi:hypothetical protein
VSIRGFLGRGRRQAAPAPAARTWSEQALSACLNWLTRPEFAAVEVHDAWVDGPDAFCVVYRPVEQEAPWDPSAPTRPKPPGLVGLRRTSDDAAHAVDGELGDLVLHYDVGPGPEPEPVPFGRNVAHGDLASPVAHLAHALRADADGIGWWGTLRRELPRKP